MCFYVLQMTSTDNEDPVFINVQDIIVTASANTVTANVTWDEDIVSDNSGNWTLTSDFGPGDTFPLGDTNVTYTAVDPYGNNATTSFTVTVEGMIILQIR